jgi:hypothetical protein
MKNAFLRVTSRAKLLAAMEIGDTMHFECPVGDMPSHMSMIRIDAMRVGAKISQSKMLGIHLATNQVIHLIRVERVA